jgi:hypothetical protein
LSNSSPHRINDDGARRHENEKENCEGYRPEGEPIENGQKHRADRDKSNGARQPEEQRTVAVREFSAGRPSRIGNHDVVVTKRDDRTQVAPYDRRNCTSRSLRK